MGHVVVLHGMWLNGLSMRVLAHRLRAAGHQVDVLNYNMLLPQRGSIIDQVTDILRRDPHTHVVAHSLGGLIALKAIEQLDTPHLGRVVCLGSPIAGSHAAVNLARSGKLARRAMHRHFPLLAEGVGSAVACTQVGVVAGTRPAGLGRFFSGVSAPSDGTVAVKETCVPGLAGHAEIPCGHTGLVFSRKAADLALRFIDHGRFD